MTAWMCPGKDHTAIRNLATFLAACSSSGSCHPPHDLAEVQSLKEPTGQVAPQGNQVIKDSIRRLRNLLIRLRRD